MPIVPVTPDTLRDAAERLRRGELVAFPTETVYGLGAHALDADAVARIFAAKGRPAWNPVIVHVPSVAEARALVREWPDRAERLAASDWPGPLTLVLRKRTTVPDVVTAGTDTVALRVPSHPVALALLREAGVPIAAPSANRFTQLSPTTAAHVAQGLGSRVSLILDGGPCAVGIESTVLDLTGDVPTILRAGVLDAETLAARLGEPVRDGTHQRGARSVDDAEAPRPAPGMMDRHYAPRADLWLVDAAGRADVEAVLAEEAGRVATGAVAIGDGWAPPTAAPLIRLPVDPEGYARGLYAALHALDAAGCARVIVTAPPTTGRWTGIHDRLSRATR
jgi:L-threonylcarbamoyladenylate synthase